MCEKQQGASIVFGTSGGTWNMINISRFSAPVPVLDDTHLGTTGHREKCPGDLEDPQMITVIAQNDGNQAYPAKKLVQTITVNHPLGAYATAEKYAGTGFVVDVRTPEFQSDSEAIQTIEIDIQFDGKTGPARTLAVAA